MYQVQYIYIDYRLYMLHTCAWHCIPPKLCRPPHHNTYSTQPLLSQELLLINSWVDTCMYKNQLLLSINSNLPSFHRRSSQIRKSFLNIKVSSMNTGANSWSGGSSSGTWTMGLDLKRVDCVCWASKPPMILNRLLMDKIRLLSSLDYCSDVKSICIHIYGAYPSIHSQPNRIAWGTTHILGNHHSWGIDIVPFPQSRLNPFGSPKL